MDSKKVLLLHPGGIGDSIMLIPLIKAISEQGYKVDVLCKNKAIVTVMENVPEVNEAILFPWLKTKDLFLNKEARQMLTYLRKKKYYAGLQPFQGRGIFSVLIMLFSGIKRRYHHTYRFKFLKKTGLFLTKHIPFKEQHSLYNNIELAKIANLLPKDYIVKEEFSFNKIKYLEKFDELAQKYFKTIKNIIALYPGGGDEEFAYKRWKLEYWEDLIHLIKSKYPQYVIAVFLGPGEKNIANFFHNIKNSGIDIKVLDNIELADVISLLSKVDLFIGNDGGLAHVVSIFERKEIVIYGPTDWRYVYPLNKNFYKVLPKNYKPIFIPYKNLIADLSENRINDIKPVEVFKVVEQVIRK